MVKLQVLKLHCFLMVARVTRRHYISRQLFSLVNCDLDIRFSVWVFAELHYDHSIVSRCHALSYFLTTIALLYSPSLCLLCISTRCTCIAERTI